MRTLVYPGRLERLGRGTGLDFGAALQELVVAFGESRDDWVILFGGRFPTGGLVRALDEVLRDEGRAWRYRANEGELVAPGGLTIAQASDGVIILASSTDWARRAEGASGTPWRHGLEPSARASFVTGASTLRQLAGGPMATLVPELGALGLVRQVRGSLSPAEPMTLRVTVAFSGEIASAERVQELDALRRVVRGSRSLVPAASWLGAEALDGAQMVAGPERSVVFELSWRQRQLDRTIGSAVNAISACVTAAAGAG